MKSVKIMDESIKNVIDIFNSFNEENIKFICVGILPNWSEDKIKELEIEILKDGWKTTTYEPPGAFIKGDGFGRDMEMKTVRIKGVKEHIRLNGDSSRWKLIKDGK